jgi:acyl carrier protein
MNPNDDTILERIQVVIAETLRIPRESVRPDSLLHDGLGAESLDFVDIEFKLETEFGVEFYHDSVMEKLSELFAPRQLEADGRLTAFGAEILRLRMTEAPEGAFQPDGPANPAAVFTPRTWLRAVRELLDARPTTCPHCGSAELAVTAPSVLRCGGCGKQIMAPAGGECIEAWAASLALPAIMPAIPA